MFHSPWIRKLLGVPRSRRQRRRQAVQMRRPVRLTLESLEERLTPAGGNPTVTQTAGSFAQLTGLLAGDTAPNTNYVIQITGSFTFTSGGQVTISKLGTGSTLTIETPGGGSPFTLTGNGNRLFDVTTGQNVTLKDLTLTGGSGVSDGGGILDAGGNLTLSGVTLKTNRATGTTTAVARGGGVFVSAGGTLSLNNSLIANNSATATAAGLVGAGGGIYSSGASTITISDSTLSGNKAVGGAGVAGTLPGGNGSDGGAAWGGGLYLGGKDWTATLKGDTLSGNAAAGGAGGAGAAGVNNSATSKGNGGNGGKGGAGGAASGGALYATGSGTLTVLNDLAAPLTHPSLMIGNTAGGGAGGAGGDGGAGGSSGTGGNGGDGGVGGSVLAGALFLSSVGGDTLTADIGNTTIYGNTAADGLGGAGGAGGSGGTLGTPGANGASGGAAGGGAYFSLAGSGGVTMVNSTVATNSGGGIDGILADDATKDTFFNNTFIISNALVAIGTPPNEANDLTTTVGGDVGPVVGVGTGGPIYYPLLPGSSAIGAGSTSVLGTISSVLGTVPAVDLSGQLRTSNGTASGSISLGALQPLVPNAPLATTVAPGDVSVNFYDANPSPAFTISAAVNASTGTASGGVLSIYLNSDNNNPPTLLGMATVSANGIATINVPAGTLPSNLQVGKYDLVENYSGDASYDPSNAIGALNVTADATTVVPGNATVNFGSSTPFTITVGVNSPNGTVNSGTVTISLVSANTTTNLTPTPLTVSGGIATGSVTNATALTAISKLMPGSYQLIETYADVTGGQFAGSSGTGTLTVNSISTTVVPGNATVNFGITTPFSISATVNSASGTVSGGTVAFTLDNDNTTTPLGSATVGSNGVATLSVTGTPLTVISGLQTGNYQLVETYSGNSPFGGSSATGTLTVTAAPTSVVPGNATMDVGTSGPFIIPVGVNSPAGTINSGDVSISLVNGANVLPLGMSTVGGGVALVNVAGGPLSSLHNGNYQLIESFTDVTGGQFANSTGIGTLTVNPSPIPSTAVIPANATVSSNDGMTLLSVVVNSPSGPVDRGTVTITLINGGSATVVGSAPVSGGVAHVNADIPSLAAGTYQLEETYTDTTGHFGGSSAIGTLTAEPLPPGTAALELAIDAAALALMSNLGALMELRMFADVFLHHTIPGSPSDLVNSIQTLYPKTGELGLLSIGAGMFLAQDLQQENPTH